jgi:nucleotide-binding universal stress UspA family protein
VPIVHDGAIPSVHLYREVHRGVGFDAVAIVVGVDGSEESREALRWALAEAQLRHIPLRAVWAWRPPREVTPIATPLAPAPVYEPVSEKAAEEARRATERHLDAIVAEVGGDLPEAAGVRIEQEAIEGHAAEVLVRAADGEDLLVVGSRGRGGFKGLLLGSVSQACTHHARCPVVVVRPERDESVDV